jgi:hypothetical protein
VLLCRQRSGKELWALVRQFAADKKTPGRSLYLLSRDKNYSVVGHVFSQLFPEDYDRVSQTVLVLLAAIASAGYNA